MLKTEKAQQLLERQGIQKNTKTMIAQTLQTKQLSADGFTWNLYSPRVATITNELIHFSPVAYIAFHSWDEAHNFWKSITDKRYCTRAQVREAERFSTGWQVKIWGMPQATLDKLIERDRSRALPLPPVRRDWPIAESYSAISYEAA